MVARIGSWKDNNLQIRCAREAVRLINYYIENHIYAMEQLNGKEI
jgi:predicted ABC-type ATPase